MKEYISEVLFSREEIDEKVKELGREITEDYRGKNLLCICILKGAIAFMSDLIKEIDLPLEIDFMAVSSYDGTYTSGDVKIVKDLDTSVVGKDVLIVEDIIDTGITLSRLVELFKTRGANSVSIATFLSKPKRRKIDVDVKYTGFKIEDKFAIGYGMDHNEKFRNLPYIGVYNGE